MWLFLVPIILIALILILFWVVHWRERGLPIVERKLSLSLWIGAASLLPGLTHVTPLYGGSLFDLTFESASEVRGWPMAWWGYQGFGMLFAPLALLIDIVLVAMIALVCFGLVGILERRMPQRVSRERVALPLALVLVLFPLWGGILVDAYNASIGQLSYWQYDGWIKRNAETAMGSIQLEQCSSFTLVPSLEHPGAMNIQVTVTARVRTPGDFELRAHIREMVDDTEMSSTSTPLKQQLPTGEHTLEFVLHPIDADSDYVRIDKPGPYKILVVVNRISVEESRFGGFFGSEEFKYARDNLGISSDNLRLECQSPAYTLADLGLSISPTSQP